MSDRRNPFGSTRINWAENMLMSHSNARSKQATALVSLIEPPAGGKAAVEIARHTFEQLYEQVKFAAAGLRNLGVGPGDRVAAVTCNNAGQWIVFGRLVRAKMPSITISQRQLSSSLLRRHSELAGLARRRNWETRLFSSDSPRYAWAIRAES